MNEGREEGEEKRRNLRALLLPEQQGPDCELNHSNVSGLTHTTQQRVDTPWAWCERMGGGSDRDTLAIEQRSQSNLYRKMITVTPVNRSQSRHRDTDIWREKKAV